MTFRPTVICGWINWLPRRMHAAHRCGLLLQMTHVAWSMCPFVLGTRVSCAKTAETIKMPFEGQTHLGSRNPTFWWGLDPHGKGHFWRDMSWPIVTYLHMSAFRIVRLSPHAAVECIRRREGWHGDAASCQITLNTCYYYYYPAMHRDAEGIIFYRCGFFFILFSTPNIWGQWTDLNQT